MRIQLFSENQTEDLIFEEYLNGFHISKNENQPAADADFIIVSLDCSDKNGVESDELEIIKELRRDHFAKAPILAYSFKSFDCFKKSDDDFSILETKGVGFLRMPFSREELLNKLDELKEQTITHSELVAIVRNNCNLQEKWRNAAHKIGNCLTDYSRHKSRIEHLFRKWKDTIDRFSPDAPETYDHLKKINYLLALPITSSNIEIKLRTAFQELEQSLNERKISHPEPDPVFMKCPPAGFSEILIADDEPLDSLIFDLEKEYRYKVRQAKGFKEAKRLLEKNRPAIILSDYFFKNSAHDKTADKKFGVKLMQYAANFNIGLENEPKKPIVAVISKSSLDPLEIPSQVIDCSGVRNSTNPEFIHRAIWAEAKKRGVEQGKVGDVVWKLEHICRERIEAYQSELPVILKKWESFNSTVRETLIMIKSVYDNATEDEKTIVGNIINILEPYGEVNDFSYEQIERIFSQIEKEHKEAKKPPASEVKQSVRNILHGKIEQFTAVVNHIEFARKVFAKISADLIFLTEYRKIGNRIKATIENFDEAKPLSPFLSELRNDIEESLKILPPLPDRDRETIRPIYESNKKIHIIVVEDNKVWTEVVLSAVKRVKQKLEGKFAISHRHFDNVQEALKNLPPTVRYSSYDENDEERRTIAIIDICLPENNGTPNQIPDMIHGFRLLENLSDYANGIPIIVFSTKSSLADIREIGKFGVSDENFISKESTEPETEIIQSLISLIVKKQKCFLRRHGTQIKGKTYYEFSLNGICIPFSKKLNAVFEALYELRDESDIADKTVFSPKEIFQRKSKNAGNGNAEFTKLEKRSIQAQIKEIRELIYNTFKRNSQFIDVRHLIKTEETGYRLNAELPSFEDEENYEEDIEIFKNRKYNILIVGVGENYCGQMAGVLESISHSVRIVDYSDDNFTQTVSEFRPDIVCLNLTQVEIWRNIKTILAGERLGVVVMTTNAEPNNKRLIDVATKELGIPSQNLVGINNDDWINTFLTILDNNKRRIFLGEKVKCVKKESAIATDEPIIRILPESDLENGILKLRVNDHLFTMNKSNISKIIGLLLDDPKTLIPLEVIKKKITGTSESVTKDEQTGWTRKIRNKIQKEWLKTDDRKQAMSILISSEKGMMLNVQVIKN